MDSSPGGCDDGIVRKQCTAVDSRLCLGGQDWPHRFLSVCLYHLFP